MAVKDTTDCWRFRAASSVLKLFISIASTDPHQQQNTQQKETYVQESLGAVG